MQEEEQIRVESESQILATGGDWELLSDLERKRANNKIRDRMKRRCALKEQLIDTSTKHEEELVLLSVEEKLFQELKKESQSTTHKLVQQLANQAKPEEAEAIVSEFLDRQSKAMERLSQHQSETSNAVSARLRALRKKRRDAAVNDASTFLSGASTQVWLL